MAGRPGDNIMRAGGFIHLTSLLFISTVCPPFAMISAAWPFHPHPHARFDSLHQTMIANNAAPHYYYESGSVEDLHWATMAPAAPPKKHRRKRAPSPHGMKTTKVKRRQRKDKNKLKGARTVGYFFAGIAILLQVAVVAFLLIKRKQMIGFVHKYDEAPPEWNGIHGPA